MTMNKNNVIKSIITIILFFITCLFMNGFYKSLSGFIANNFDDPLMMVAMLISYIIAVICFFTYFYNYYIKKIDKLSSIIYSSLVIAGSSVSLVLIFININIFAYNNSLGAYESIPSIIVMFPYDMILTHIVLIIGQILNLCTVFKQNSKLFEFKERNYSHGYFKLKLIEFIPLTVLGIFAFFTVGDFISGLISIENALYDAKYIFLLLWVLTIPMINLLSFVFKIEQKEISPKNKVIYLSSLIFINVIFGLLLFVFELVDPNFITQVGKPLFPITFSVSIPIEMIVLLAIQLISIIVNIVKIILCIKRK